MSEDLKTDLELHMKSVEIIERLSRERTEARAAARWYFEGGGTLRGEQALAHWPWLGSIEDFGPVPAKD